MITFHDGAPPLGAFSVGDLDTADGVSFLVPGMGSSLGDTTQYMRAGANVLATQQQIGADTAIVSWIGYEAPPNAAAPATSAFWASRTRTVGNPGSPPISSRSARYGPTRS